MAFMALPLRLQFSNRISLRVVHRCKSQQHIFNSSGSFRCSTAQFHESEAKLVSDERSLSSAYSELHLDQIKKSLPNVRVRQHANPLSSNIFRDVEAPDWSTVFQNPNLPLHLDIGCGSGRYLLVLAKRNSGLQNYLGLEIRDKLVERAQEWVHGINLKNIHIMFGSANACLPQLLDSYPGDLVFVSVLCPDPHFKVRHRKRRVVQPELVAAIATHLKKDGKLYVASDVLEVAEDMRDQISTHGSSLFQLVESGTSTNSWLSENPLTVPTEREVSVLRRGEPMYRLMYRRTD